MTAEEFIEKKNLDWSKNNIIKTKDISREGFHCFVREAWTFMVQSTYRDKVYVIERLRKDNYIGTNSDDINWGKGNIEYRLGYYIVGKIGRAKNRWTWGQFSPLIAEEDFEKLMEKAKKENTIKQKLHAGR